MDITITLTADEIAALETAFGPTELFPDRVADAGAVVAQHVHDWLAPMVKENNDREGRKLLNAFRSAPPQVRERVSSDLQLTAAVEPEGSVDGER